MVKLRLLSWLLRTGIIKPYRKIEPVKLVNGDRVRFIDNKLRAGAIQVRRGTYGTVVGYPSFFGRISVFVDEQMRIVDGVNVESLIKIKQNN